MTGTEYKIFCTEVNGGAAIGNDLLFQLINIARALVEQRRPWVVLSKTDTAAKTVTTNNTWA